mmetsp:Transcript_33865/g.86919  ORF Transcript_33865/g.86919 Transcript_33865/m.86919 type:complete len:198 (-) Transcript_33865:1229-1822(-)|eukprot:CAMPEP_0113874340 /NCGR_PEP_ID=MMETSP0780_2-20120614/4277_1 /TAXON_ID=652834 /ORGANISM="Palpitomonas bilix" /LENGTH=197 /DNA_ID=CAMNT_0000860097 /DNA_START=94 /DNA_END=687 /DNA_ORIENTATION=- /assembly_acc=CAM_ASM_000599
MGNGKSVPVNKAALSMFDKDGDGRLTIPELRDALRKLGINLSDHDFNKLVRSLQKRVEKDEIRDKERRLRQQQKEAILLGRPLPEGDEIDIQAFLKEQRDKREEAKKKRQALQEQEEKEGKKPNWALQEEFGDIKNPAKVGKKEMKYFNTREVFLRRVAELEMNREVAIAKKVATKAKNEGEMKEKMKTYLNHYRAF